MDVSYPRARMRLRVHGNNCRKQFTVAKHLLATLGPALLRDLIRTGCQKSRVEYPREETE